MDTIIEKKSFIKEIFSNKVRLFKYTASILFLIIIIYFFSGNSVDRGLIRISTVKIADLKTEIEGTGIIKSASVELYYSPSETFVKKVYLKEGELVQTGDTILILDNTELKNKIFELSNKIRISNNQLKTKEIEYEQQLLSNQKNKEKYINSKEKHQYELNAAQKLFEMGAVSKSSLLAKKAELENDEIDLKFLGKAQILEDRKLKQEINTLKLNIEILKQELSFENKNLLQTILIAKNNGAIIKQSFEAGQKVANNELVAQISNQKDYLIEAQFSQRQFDRLSVGMRSTIELNNKKYSALLTLLQAEIKNGYGIAEIKFSGEVTANVRQNQRVNIAVETGFKKNTLVVERGAFLSSGGKFAYKVIDDKAIKIPIEIGGKNLQLVEILSGVNEGDKIIVSNINDYLDWAEFKIQ
jgi:HlyD family secretion protein